MLPKVSVVTVTKNIIRAGREKYLKQNADSVLAQDYTGTIEHIFIDGDSADGTQELLRSICSLSRGRSFISEPDSGIYDAMNKGIRYSTGDYLIFLNSDDYFSTNKAISTSINFILQTNSDFSYGYYRILDGKKISHIRTAELGLFYCRMPFCHQTMLTRRQVLEEVGGFDDKNYTSAADFDLVLRLICAGKKAVCSNREMVVFRYGGLSTNVQRSCNEVIFSIKKNLSHFETITDKMAEVIYHQMAIPLSLYFKLERIVDDSVLYEMNFNFNNMIEESSMIRYVGLARSSYFNDIKIKKFKTEKKCGMAYKILFLLKQVFVKWMPNDSIARRVIRRFYFFILKFFS